MTLVAQRESDGVSAAARPLGRVWLVTNAGSGSTDAGVTASARAALAAHGAKIARCEEFPAVMPPDAAALDAANIDTLVIVGGDGTINVAVDTAGEWRGQCLVLPGGTMNMLAKALHGDVDMASVIAAVGGARLVTLPTAEAQGRRALVGIILGPAAAWVHTREGVRKGRFMRAIRAARLAWARTFGQGVRVIGSPGRHRAVIVTPMESGLDIVTVDASGIGDVVRLGWTWLTGDWREAAGVGVRQAASVQLAGRRRVRALFDGEPAMLASPVTIVEGRTGLHFVATR